jgi:proteasome accessory factor B
MYLIAQVPKYRQLRAFAVERIKSLSVTAETFDAPEGAPADPFPHSLGVHTGPPEKIEIEFSSEAAGHVRERSWHPSQQVREKADGSIRLTLNVCNDWALRSWVLSFGPLARVVSPSTLAEAILEQLEDARTVTRRILILNSRENCLTSASIPSCHFSPRNRQSRRRLNGKARRWIRIRRSFFAIPPHYAMSSTGICRRPWACLTASSNGFTPLAFGANGNLKGYASSKIKG